MTRKEFWTSLVMMFTAVTGLKAAADAPGEPANPKRGGPTGSGLMYIREKIEPVLIPAIEGERTTATVPDTLDLAERARLGIRGMTSCANPNLDYEIYYWMGMQKGDKAMMQHSFHDHNGGEPKWLEAIALQRTMSGSTENAQADRAMMTALYHMIDPKTGLFFMPVEGAPWVGLPHCVEPWVKKGAKQTFNIWPASRALLCMSAWLARDPENAALKANIETQIDGLLKIAMRKDNYCFLPSMFWDGEIPKPELPTGMEAAYYQSATITAIGHYYRLTKSPKARELGEMLMNYWLGPAKILDEAGNWNKGIHFHGTTMALQGMLDFALATGNEAAAQKIRHAFEFARGFGEPMGGWFPEVYPSTHNYTEPCTTADMVILASKLSAAGLGDYHEEIERWTRNMLAATQVTDGWFIDRLAAEGKAEQEIVKVYKSPFTEFMEQAKSTPVDPRRESVDRVADRMRGTFSMLALYNGQMDSMSQGCCTGNGNRALFYAWRRIVEEKDGVLKVNLLLNRASQWADVDSYLPHQGRVDIRMKKPERLIVRIPSWVKSEGEVKCEVAGQPRACKLQGRYLAVGEVKPGEKVIVTFPLERQTLKLKVHDKDYTVEFRGFNAVDIWPLNSLEPFYADPTLRSETVRWKTVERFAPRDELTALP